MDFITPIAIRKSSSGSSVSPYSTPRGEVAPIAPSKDHRAESRFPQTDTAVDPKLMRASEAEFTQLSKDTEKKRKELENLKQEVSRIEEKIQAKKLELENVTKENNSRRSKGTDLSRKAIVVDEIVADFETKKILQRQPGEPDYKFFHRVRDYILQSSRAKAKFKITQVLEALKQFSSKPLLSSPRRSSTDSHDDHPLSISEIDLKISENSQDLLVPYYGSKESSSPSRHENKKVLDIEPFLNFLTNFLEDLSNETKEIDIESLESAINSLKEGIAEIKSTVCRNKSTYIVTNARLQSFVSESARNDHSLRFEELSTEFYKIEELLSQISSKTEDKKIKDDSLKEKVEILLLEIKSITAGFQNLQQELGGQIRQEQQDKERSDQAKSSEDDELKEKLIGILTKLDDQDDKTFSRRNSEQKFSEVSDSPSGGGPINSFSARRNVAGSGDSEINKEDVDEDSEDLTAGGSSTPRGEPVILFSSRKTNPGFLRQNNLQDLLFILEDKLSKKLEEFKIDYRLQARLAEDSESEEYIQEIESKKIEIANLEERIQENLKKIEELEQQVDISKQAQERAEAEATKARAEVNQVKAEAAAARAEAEASGKKAQEAQERAEAKAAAFAEANQAKAEADAARAKAEAAARAQVNQVKAETAAARAEAEASEKKAREAQERVVEIEAELERSKQYTQQNKGLEQEIKEVESTIQKIQQAIAARNQNPQSQSLTPDLIELIKEMIGAISQSNKQSLEALREISTSSTDLIKQTGDTVRDSIQPILDAQQDLIKTTLEQQKHQLELIFTQLTEDRKTSAEERTALMRKITELSQSAKEQQLAFLERMERQQQTSLQAMQAQQESLLAVVRSQQEATTAERRDLIEQVKQSQEQQIASLQKMQEQHQDSIKAMQEQHQTSLAEMKKMYDERVDDIKQQLLQNKQLNEKIIDLLGRLSQGQQLPPASTSSPSTGSSSPAPRRPPPKIPSRPTISAPPELTGPVQMSEKTKPKDPLGGLEKTTRELKPASTLPRTSVVPISSTLLDKQEVVRNFLYEVAVNNEKSAKGYYNGTIDGSSIRNIIDGFFNKEGIKLQNVDQAYLLIKSVIDRDRALKDSFTKKQRIIPDNFFKLLLKENQQGAGR